MLLEVLAITTIFALAVAPLLIFIWGMHYIAGHPQLYIYRNLGYPTYTCDQSPTPQIVTERWVNISWLDPLGYIGDTSCRFNAHSPLLRCAVNPVGPCQNCSCYEASSHLKDLDVLDLL